jgi:hypothetical protein
LLNIEDGAQAVGETIPRNNFGAPYDLDITTSKTAQQSDWDNMPREAEISINEREFIKQALQEQIRLDGRAFDAFRSLELTFGEEYGVADVQLGKTR